MTHAIMQLAVKLENREEIDGKRKELQSFLFNEMSSLRDKNYSL